MVMLKTKGKAIVRIRNPGIADSDASNQVERVLLYILEDLAEHGRPDGLMTSSGCGSINNFVLPPPCRESPHSLLLQRFFKVPISTHQAIDLEAQAVMSL